MYPIQLAFLLLKVVVYTFCIERRFIDICTLNFLYLLIILMET